MQGSANYQNQSDKTRVKLLPNLALCSESHYNSLLIEKETAKEVIPIVL